MLLSLPPLGVPSFTAAPLIDCHACLQAAHKQARNSNSQERDEALVKDIAASAIRDAMHDLPQTEKLLSLEIAGSIWDRVRGRTLLREHVIRCHVMCLCARLHVPCCEMAQSVRTPPCTSR
jgi:hypothetical protein